MTTYEEWHECGGIPVCETRYEPDTIEDYLDYLDFSNQKEKLSEEIELLTGPDEWIHYLKVKYGYEIEEDSDNEFDPNEIIEF